MCTVRTDDEVRRWSSAEDGLEVLARNRADLLKSITEGYDYNQEAGHYLVSVENIIRSGIDYEATNEDLICLKAATDILKQTLSPQEMIDYLERTEPDVERTIEPRGRPSSFTRNISRLLPQYMTDHHYKGRITGGHDVGMAHGKWPERNLTKMVITQFTIPSMRISIP